MRLYSNSMDRQYSIYRYSTRLVHDNKEGNSALELDMTAKMGLLTEWRELCSIIRELAR